MNDIRMIAMDMDGTLLTSNNTISPRTADALRQAQDMGLLVTVCSGRFPEYASVIVEDAGLRLPVIGINGGELWLPDGAGGRVLSAHYMDRRAAREIVAILMKTPCCFFIFGQKHVVSISEEVRHPSETRNGKALSERYGIRFSHGPEAVLRALEADISKIFVYGFENDAARAALWRQLAGAAGTQVTSSAINNLELMPLGVDKAAGCREMAALHGVTLPEVMAFGDYDNDIPMIAGAGFGVAMGNGSEAVKRVAKYVTDTNDNDGIAHALRKFVIMRE